MVAGHLKCLLIPASAVQTTKTRPNLVSAGSLVRHKEKLFKWDYFSFGMKKIPLEAISKNDGMFSLVLVKNERSLQVIRRFLIAIGFEKMESSKILHPLGDADNNYDLRPYSDKLYEDVSFAFITKGFYVHLAFGLKKILLAIYCRTRGGSARLNRQLWEYFEIRSLG